MPPFSADSSEPAAGGPAPVTRILLWVLLTAFMHRLDFAALLALTALLGTALLLMRPHPFARLLRRTRVLLISLVAVYTVATPGEALLPAWGALSPTPEGFTAGALQALRLLVLLAALALLLARCDRNCLLSGLYSLLRPLRVAGVDADRIVARIWLALYYAEHGTRGGFTAWWRELQRTEPAEVPPETQTIRFTVERAGWRDGMWLLAAGAVLAALTQV